MKFLITILLTMASSAFAYNIGAPVTVSDQRWNAVGLLPSPDCTDLRVDITGDLLASRRFSIYGELYCTKRGTIYQATGAGYVDTNGGLSFQINIGPFWVWSCNGGRCTVWNLQTQQNGVVGLENTVSPQQ
jgi:hypothetical protein